MKTLTYLTSVGTKRKVNDHLKTDLQINKGKQPQEMFYKKSCFQNF